MELILPLDLGLTRFSINGKSVPSLETNSFKGIDHYYFRLISPSYIGDRIRLEYRGQDSLSFSVIEVLHGLPDFDNIQPMPSHIIPEKGYESSMTFVKSRFVLQ